MNSDRSIQTLSSEGVSVTCTIRDVVQPSLLKPYESVPSSCRLCGVIFPGTIEMYTDGSVIVTSECCVCRLVGHETTLAEGTSENIYICGTCAGLPDIQSRLDRLDQEREPPRTKTN